MTSYGGATTFPRSTRRGSYMMAWKGRTVATAALQGDGQHIGHAGDAANLGLNRLRNRIIDREDHHGVAARMVAADLHARDVDVLLAKERPNGPDDPGPIGMPAHQEGALWHKVDTEVVELHDVRLVEQQRAADPGRSVLARGLERGEVGELTCASPSLLYDSNAVRSCHGSGVDRVDALGAEPAEEGGQHRRRQQGTVIVSDLARVINLEAGRRLPPDL